MQKQKIQIAMCACFTIAACTILFARSASAATEELLYTFTGGNDGSGPDAGLTPDGAGNFYGSTFIGGTNGLGVVFKLTRTADGWTETVLYNFKGGSEDGSNPAGNLVLDAAGNIYGITDSGGKGFGVQNEPGFGTAFELSPSASGWTETIIHFFTMVEGIPSSGFVRDAAGNLYGETGGGGKTNSGTVYQMKPGSDEWEYRILYDFNGGNDGNYPYGGLILDTRGNLYGTTIEGGGPKDYGTVFELLRGADGSWTESQLHAFHTGADGVSPEAPVVFDAAGNLYGTTLYGGDVSCAQGYGCGLVFELSPSGGTWTKTTLYVFPGAPDGHAPSAGMAFDQAGNLFGTTSNGGSANTGALFELVPQSGGGWTESIVESFTGPNGSFVMTPLMFDGAGNLYGTAQNGGNDSHGLVFEFPGLGK
jgi:uncharacterized repeat protein (TIGR03803 family)